MKKVFTFLLLTFLFIININADVTMSYDKAVNNSQRYVYKFNKYGKYIITDKKYIEIVNSDTAIIPFAFKNNKSTVNTDFTRGGLLNEEEFIVSKDSNGNTYLSQDVEFFLMKDGTIKAINVLNNDVIDAGDKKYALRVTEFVIPGTKTKGSGTKNNPWEFVGTHKLTFYIENGKITNNNLLVNKYIVYAVESTEGQIVINFKPDSTFAYYNNNCDFEYEYDKTNKIHRIFKSNKDITSDKECTINLTATGLLVQYDLNGGTGNCENLSVTKGSKLTNICTSVSKPGYMFKGWKDASGNTVTKDTIVNDNLKLTAEWEIKKYTLTVKPNGGVWNNQTENKTIEQEYMSTTTIDNPTKGSTYKITFDSNNTNATISKNIVEAERPFNNWKLTKDVNDVTTKLENNKFTFGTSNATIEANYKVNSNNTTLALISKAGHTCKWNTKSNGSGTSYSSGYTKYSANSNITLYAICSANSYKVLLDNQGATTAGTSSVSVTYGKNISNITVPAKKYKVTLVYDSTKTEEKMVKLTFGGYYSETNGKGIQYINASGSGVKAYDKAKDTTLYAKWNSASITLPTPSKTGNTFAGWYTQSSGGTKVSNTYTPTGNVTLYAHWTNVNYTLTINPNGGTWNNTTSNSTKTGTVNSKLSIANPTPKGYTVSFNPNGGNNVNSITSQRTFKNWSLSGPGSMSGTTYTFGAGNATLTANYNNGSITLPSATKAGHKFKGWYSNGCGTTLIGNAGESYTPTSNITLKACYSYIAYILDVYPNGGTWNGTTKMTRIEPLADPKPSIYGNKDYTGKIYSTIDIPNPIPPSGYTVSFNTNGGSSVSSIASTKSFDGWDNSSPGKFSGTTYKYGEGSGYIMAKYKNNSVNLPTPTKSGYTFVGWYTASSGGTKVSNTYIPEKNITLYAHWSANSYTLTINPNGGTWNNTTSNSTKTGTTNSTLSITNPTPKGYTVSFNSDGGNNVNNITSQRTFTNWSLSGSGSISGTTYTFGSGNATLTANYSNGSITLPRATKAGHKFKGWYSNGCRTTFIGNAEESYTPTSNVTLKACYSYYAYILDVYPNGGTWNGTTEKTRIDPLADPKPSIYGNKDYTGKIYSTIDIPNPIPPSGYTVSFNTNGGSSVSSIASTKSFDGWDNSSPGKFSGTTYKYGEGSGYIMAKYKNNSVNLPTPTKSGYTFVGWYTASSGGTKVSNTYIPEKNITLYAHWSANSYRLSFDANGCGTLGISFVTATIDKTYGDADDGDGLPSIAIKAGKNFDGWYTSSSGGNKITNSTKVTASSDNGILYAHCTNNKYNIKYNYNGGTKGSSAPTIAEYFNVINISNPTKKVKVTLNSNNTGATISATSVSAAQTFTGWTANNIKTSTAQYGTTTSVGTYWSDSSTLAKGPYFENLNPTNNSTVTLIANWSQKGVKLPTITKTGYTCGWASSASATTYTYASGAIYVPNAYGSTKITLYGVCKANNLPVLTLKVSDKTNGQYTCKSGTCTLTSDYQLPVTFDVTATSDNANITKLVMNYNKAYQSTYTEITDSSEQTITPGRTVTSSYTLNGPGHRVIQYVATDANGRSTTVTVRLNIAPESFASQNNCSNKTITATDDIYVWRGESNCTNSSKSPCGQMQGDTIGIIGSGAELCYTETVSKSSNVIFIRAWIEESQFKYKGGLLSPNYIDYYHYKLPTTKVYDGKTYYYSKLTAWCTNSSCGYGWTITPEI